MVRQTGERNRFPDDDKCGCEIQLTKGANLGQSGDLNPRCSCGKERRKSEVNYRRPPA